MKDKPYYYEAHVKFPNMWTDIDEYHKGIVIARNDFEAKQIVVDEYKDQGGKPIIDVTIFPTLTRSP